MIKSMLSFKNDDMADSLGPVFFCLFWLQIINKPITLLCLYVFIVRIQYGRRYPWQSSRGRKGDTSSA